MKDQSGKAQRRVWDRLKSKSLNLLLVQNLEMVKVTVFGRQEASLGNQGIQRYEHEKYTLLLYTADMLISYHWLSTTQIDCAAGLHGCFEAQVAYNQETSGI